MCKLCYLADLFKKPNELNASLHGENTNTFVLKNKIQAFIIKLDVWLQKVQNYSFEMFSYTQDFIVEKKFNVDLIKPIVTDHLACLKNNFQKYFAPELDNNQMDYKLFHHKNQQCETPLIKSSVRICRIFMRFRPQK